MIGIKYIHEIDGILYLINNVILLHSNSFANILHINPKTIKSKYWLGNRIILAVKIDETITLKVQIKQITVTCSTSSITKISIQKLLKFHK